MVAMPRTLGQLSWLGLAAVTLIFLCGLLAMIGAGRNPTPNRVIQATVSTNFYEAFLAITGPVSLLTSSQTNGPTEWILGLCICWCVTVIIDAFNAQLMEARFPGHFM